MKVEKGTLYYLNKNHFIKIIDFTQRSSFIIINTKAKNYPIKKKSDNMYVVSQVISYILLSLEYVLIKFIKFN
jgi:hypothetical protein